MSTTAGQQSALLLMRRIVSMLEWLSSIVLMLMMLLTFVDVIGRYLLNKPVFGAAEMISTLLAFTIFAGLGLVNARDSHITVDLLEPFWQKSFPRLQTLLTRLASLLAMALIVFVLVEQAIEAAAVGSMTVVLELPLSGTAALVAALAATSLVCQVLELILSSTAIEPVDEQTS